MKPQQERSEASLAERLSFPLQEFVQHDAAGGVLLLACALVALAWTNSPWKGAYADLWRAEVTLGTVHLHLTESLRHWVNDGLMAVFGFGAKPPMTRWRDRPQ